MAGLDLDAMLNKTYFCIDVIALLADVENYLEFSEENIQRQKAHELELAANTQIVGDDDYLQRQYQAHLIENANYHCDVSLTQRVRYAGLTALITTIDWCVQGFRKKLTFELPKKPDKTNPTVHLLAVLNDRSGLPYADNIADLEGLIHVRNCVVHAAGLIEGYKHKKSLAKVISKLQGVELSDENYLGPSVAVDRNALPSRIAAMKHWLPDLDEQCTELGLFAS